MRPGCHLCEDALEWLEQLASEHQSHLELMNILDDFAVYERYKWRIPVLQIDQQVWEAPLNEQIVRQMLASNT